MVPKAPRKLQDGDPVEMGGDSNPLQETAVRPPTGQERPTRELPPGYARVYDVACGYWITVKIDDPTWSCYLDGSY